ncbi:MAG: glycosyltransferase [Clostridia bacterium]|nr:glycosyltransferase [Clostridia bacterium]
MKIIQVIPSFAFGGAEIMCENMIYALKRQGHEVCVISLFDARTPISERIEASGTDIRYLGKKPGLDLSIKGKLKKIFKAERPDAVHVHLNAIKYAAPAAKAAKIGKCVYTVHSIADKDAGGISRRLNDYFFKHSMATPVALTSTVKESVSRVYGICECKVPVVFNGIDLGKCIPKDNYALGESIELLHIGSFSPVKNHEGILRAFVKIREVYPSARLRFIGGGALMDEMKQLALSLGLGESVIFEGTQSNVYPYLNAADLFVFPSHYEGMPMTLIEAMGSALPIVATEVGGIPDMLSDGESATLCPCEPDAIADACIKMLGDKSLREKLGRGALEAAQKFSADNMAASYVEIYSKK